MRTLPLLLALISAPALGATTVSLRPEVVPPGGTATLTVTTDTGAQPQLGSVPGAVLTETGRSTQVQIVNGAMSQQTTWTWQVTPTGSGDIQLGPLRVGPDKTRALTLHVDPSAAPTAQTSHSWGTTPAPRAALSGDRARASLWLGDTTPVVGQAVPMTVSAWLRGDVGGVLEGGPTLNTGDFVVDGLDAEPTREETDVDGEPYTRFTWTARLTPIRAGSYTLDATLPATLQWVEPGTRPSLFDEIANDPFFHGMLRGIGLSEPQMRSTHVDLQAHRDLEVTSTPLEGRPAGFDGIVGTLEVKPGTAPVDGRVGEPLELSWTLTGTGNLAAIQDEGLAPGEGYDTYPPEREFTPAVRSGTRGSLTFRQLVVPRQAGPLDLPVLEVAWFDPQAHSYETADITFPTIDIRGAPTESPPVAATPTAPATGRDVHRSSLLPATARREVLAAVPLAWLAVALAWLLGGRIRRLAGDLLARLGDRWQAHSLRAHLRAALRRHDTKEVLDTGLMLVEQEEPDHHSPGVLAFVGCADRARYGRIEPDPDTLEALTHGLLDALDHEEAA